MKIAVLSGSPKGMTSVTVQYVVFLRKRFPQHEFTILHVCQDIRNLEHDENAFREVIRTVEAADGVLWAFPLYVLLVHAHYKRFIELIFERGVEAAFQGRYAATFSTSIRFFDCTAHDYLGAICDDLDMNLVGSFSAAMYDLLDDRERQRLVLFAEGFFRAIETGQATPRRHAPLIAGSFTYTRATASTEAAAHKKIMLLSDAEEHQANLRAMIDKFRQCVAGPLEVVNLHDVKIRGGCLGCIQCALDNVCVYRDADEVYALYQKLMAADVLVFAGAIKDRYLSSRWKLFWDRGFFNNHVPMFVGKQIGWLISGPLSQVPNLRQILEAQAELQQANLFGLVTDECGDSRQLDRLIEGFARRMAFCVETGYIGPPTFLGVSAARLFRDEIWASLRFVFRADHRYYKKHGLYNFPKRSIKTRISDAWMGLLTRIPSFRREFLKRIKTEMVKPLEELLETLYPRVP